MAKEFGRPQRVAQEMQKEIALILQICDVPQRQR